MKKSLLAISAAAIALSGMAATPKQQQRHVSPSISFDRSLTMKTRDGKVVGSFAQKAPSKINTPEDVITSAEGRRQNMTVTATGIYVYMDEYLDFYEDETFASHFVYGEDGDVYIFNIIPGIATNSYVKGKLDGDKITVELPQTVLWNEEYEDGVNVNISQMSGDDEESLGAVPLEGESLVLSVAEDGSVVAEGLSEERVLSLNYCTDDVWAGYCTWSLAFAPFDGEFVTVPDDIEVSKNFWTFKCEPRGYGWQVSFGQGGEEVYFQGLSEIMPEAWVKASVEYDDSEGHVFIDQNQLVGSYNGSYVYTKCASIESFEMFGQVFEYYELLPDDYRYELVWDFEEETMKAKDPSVALLFNIIQDDVDYVDDIYDFSLTIQESYEGTPANPLNLEYTDMMEDFEYSIFTFDLPALTPEGDVLQTSDLSYVVYFDGDPWTFEPEEYNIAEPMEEIPWSFDDYWIMHWLGTMNHGIAVFTNGISTLGVQSIYKYNDVETRSEIVTLNLEGDPDAVGTVNAGKKVDSIKYYGLDGREVANPADGIFVKRVIFEDGSVATFKKAVR